MCNEYSKNIESRLARIEGQIKGIKQMASEGRECEDIIVQLSAVNSAITNVARLILEHHIEHCVVDGVQNGEKEKTVENLKTAVAAFSKMK